MKLCVIQGKNVQVLWVLPNSASVTLKQTVSEMSSQDSRLEKAMCMGLLTANSFFPPTTVIAEKPL